MAAIQKVDPAEVAQRLSAPGATGASVAREMGVNQSTISRIRSRIALTPGGLHIDDELLSDPDHGFEEARVIFRDYTHEEFHKFYPIGDIHLGSPAHATGRWTEWLRYFASANHTTFSINGDLFNAALKDSKSESYDETMRVGQAVKLAKAQLEPVRDLIDLMLPGNHEARIYRATGIDIMEMLADMLEIPYAPANAMLVHQVGDVEYDTYIRHGTGLSGSLNSLTKSDQVALADVYVSGHTHRQTVATADQLVRIGGRMERRKRIYVSSGSFIMYEQYAAERGYVPTRIGAPRIYFDGRRRDVHVSV